MARTNHEKAYAAALSARRIGHIVSFLGRLLMVLSVVASLALAVVTTIRAGQSRWSGMRWTELGVSVGGLFVNLLVFGVLAAVGANTRSNASKVLYDLSVGAQPSPQAAQAPTATVPAAATSPAPVGVPGSPTTVPTGTQWPTLNTSVNPGTLPPPQTN